MANVSQREKISLGYNLSCFSLSNSPSRKNSEVDFSDVFGGPPRCSSSTQPNDIDDDEDDDSNDIESIDGEEYGVWFGSMEKLAFGNQTGSRKRYPSDDFYDDIFGGDQPLLNCSLTHSPRVVVPGRNPGSRTMSPSRPSSVSEPSSSPSKFRLPSGRMTNPDVMTSTSMNQNFKYFRRSLSRLNHTIPSHSSLNGDDDRNSYQSNSLFRQASVDEKDLTSDRKVNGTTDQHEAVSNVKDSRGSKLANDNLQFHFSIYKWANKGVPMVMSSRKRSPSGSKERSTSDANMVMDSKKGFVDVNGSLSSSKRRLSPTPNTRELENRDDKDKVVGGMSVECALEGDKAESPTIEVGEACGKGPVGVKEFPVHPETVSDAIKIEHASKIRKSNAKLLHSLFGEEKEENKKAAAGKGPKQTKVSETKKPNQKNDTLSKICRKSKVRESFTREKDGRHRDEVPTKAKDYVPFLNEDYFSQVKSSVTGQSHSDKCTTGFEVRSEVNSYSTTNHDEMQDFYVNLEKTWSEFIEMVDGEAFQSEEHEYNINNGSNVAGSASNDEPNIDGISASDPKTSATTVNDNLGKGLEQTVDSQSATESQEETQLYERKVRQWSKGKEGNIRALLSTMQNVLWPNSGWKPIPLVDIIEANAVKKAYQRALLCLHPDKLQQKGAAPYQKLIAGKMFDILQEAWDQFNSLGML